MSRVRNVRDVRVIEVIRIVYIEGEGVQGDPVREIVAYYSPEGLRLAEYDEWRDKAARRAGPDELANAG